MISGINIYAAKSGAKAVPVTLFGDNLPAQVNTADLDFGAGVKVNRVVSSNKTEMVVELDIAADAVPGKRDVGLGRSVVQNALAVTTSSTTLR